MKLYRVTVEHTFFMVAEDEDDALLISQGYAGDAIKDDSQVDLIFEEEVTSLHEIPKDWRDSCPYGEGGNVRTCAEWLKHIA